MVGGAPGELAGALGEGWRGGQGPDHAVCFEPSSGS